MIEWRTCKGFEDYEVSECGDVRRARPGVSPLSRVKVGKVLRPGFKDGYPFVVIRPPMETKPRCVKVHRLVAIAFLGDPPSAKHCVAHNDGNPSNPHRNNLRWATLKENQADREIHGTLKFGEKNHLSKLSNAEVGEIRHDYEAGVSSKKLAEKYGIHRGHVWHLCRKSKLVVGMSNGMA